MSPFGFYSFMEWTKTNVVTLYEFLSVFILHSLKSVNCNFTLAVHSPKLGRAKTHFLSHFGEKEGKNMARPGFEPTISRSEVD